MQARQTYNHNTGLAPNTSRKGYSTGWKGYKHLFVFLIFLLLLTFRPAVTHAYTALFFTVAVGGMAVHFLLGKKGYLNERKTAFLLLALAYFAYLIVQGVIYETIELEVMLKNLGMQGAPCLALLLINKRTWPSALKAIVYPVLFFCFSHLISGLLTLFLGSYEPLVFWQFVIDMGPNTIYENAMWAFPYSLYVGGTVEVGPFVFRRASGFMREPGIYQILIIVSYFGVDLLNFRYKRTLKVALFLNLLLTFSTAGWGGFAAAWLYFHFFSSRYKGTSTTQKVLKRTWTALFLGGFGYWFIFGENKASLLEKLAATSGGVRLQSAIIAQREFWEHPIFGAGYENHMVPDMFFLGTVAQIGLVGTLFFAALVVIPILPHLRRREPVLVLLIPILLTSLFSQQLFNKALFFVIMVLVVSYSPGRSEQPPARQPATPGAQQMTT